MEAPRVSGSMPEGTRAGEWLPKRYSLPPSPTARSELDDAGEAPGNLAKIIAPPADFPKQSSVYQLISATERPGAAAPGQGDGLGQPGEGVEVCCPCGF